jgi:hypothetical protein
VTEVEIVLDEKTGTRVITAEMGNYTDPSDAVARVQAVLNGNKDHVIIGRGVLVHSMKVSEVRPATRGDDAE